MPLDAAMFEEVMVGTVMAWAIVALDMVISPALMDGTVRVSAIEALEAKSVCAVTLLENTALFATMLEMVKELSLDDNVLTPL